MKCLILICFVAGACAIRRRPMENPDLYQGDIAGVENWSDRNAVAKDIQRWPNGYIPYVIDGLDRYKVRTLQEVMRYYEARTCLEFGPRRKEQDYIRVFEGDGCYSYWGRTGGMQPLSLEDGCEDFGTIAHELMHAIGFDHEQNRSDRDDYLIIYWDNIDPEEFDQFRKHKPHQNRLLTKFDYESLMLYGDTAFSIDGYKKTMKAKKAGVVLRDVYEKKYPSMSDINRINKLYNCDV